MKYFAETTPCAFLIISWVFQVLYNYIDGMFVNSPALDHEFIHGLGTAWGRREAVPTVHQLQCLW